MNAVLASIQPKWCEKICHQIGTDSGGKPVYEKSVEVRKTRPKLEPPFRGYIYCTKGSRHLALMQNAGGTNLIACCDWTTALPIGGSISNGKVIGDYICDRLFKIFPSPFDGDDYLFVDEADFKATCLTADEIYHYGKGAPLWGWNISDLHIYEKPKELSEFYHDCGDNPKCEGCSYSHEESNESLDYCLECCSPLEGYKPLERPPQSWCYIQEVSA